MEIDDGIITIDDLPVRTFLVFPQILEPAQVGVVYIAGYVIAGKYRALPTIDIVVYVVHAGNQVFQVLIDQPVCTDLLPNIFHRTVVGNQFAGRGHINPIHVGITNWRRGRGKIDVAGTGVPGHLNDFLTGGSSDNGIINQHDVLATEFQINRIELLANRLFTHFLAGHDEGTPDIAIFDETFPVFNAQLVSHLHGRGPAGVRNWDNHIDIVVGPLSQHFVCM